MSYELLMEASESRLHVKRFALYFGGTMAAVLCVMLISGYFKNWGYAYVAGLWACIIGAHFTFYRVNEPKAFSHLIAFSCVIMAMNGMMVAITAIFLRTILPDHPWKWMMFLSFFCVAGWVVTGELIALLSGLLSSKPLRYPKRLFQLTGIFASALFQSILIVSELTLL